MRVAVSLLPLLFGCSDLLDTVAKATPRASLSLRRADATLTQTSDTQWDLTKVGSLGGATVTWQVNATQIATVSGLLIFNGIFEVDNKGNAGATIGNIVVNLQTKVGTKWVTKSTVAADATQDDAATAANTTIGTFTEDTASKRLLFTDASTNSTFALVPQVTLAPGSTTRLLFSASFDNNVLALATGSQVRAQIVVTFGNAKATGNSSTNLDINGNGIIDSDEAAVQSVDAYNTTTVPAQTPSNSVVTLSDSVSDITTTGTVTFSNPVININGTSATVVVNYNGGTEGGMITNCAHLTGSGQTATVSGSNFPNVTPIDLTACNTQMIGPHVCTPGAPGCGWMDGDVVSYGQANWGGDPTVDPAAALLVSQFGTVYPFSVVEIGIAGAAGFSALFTSAAAILTYQPAGGVNGPLNADLLDPTSTAAGAFGGYVLALQLDVDFAQAGLLSNTSGLTFGDLRLCNLAQTTLNGMTIRDFTVLVNTALGGGGTSGYTYDELANLSESVSIAFIGGTPTLFAQEHIVSGPSCN